MKKKKSPEIIDLPVETLEKIKSRVNSGMLLEEDKKIVLYCARSQIEVFLN